MIVYERFSSGYIPRLGKLALIFLISSREADHGLGDHCGNGGVAGGPVIASTYNGLGFRVDRIGRFPADV